MISRQAFVEPDLFSCLLSGTARWGNRLSHLQVFAIRNERT